MNPKQLHITDGLEIKPVDVFMCSNCRWLHGASIYAGSADANRDAARQSATRCCDARCEDCGEPAQQFRTLCEACLQKHEEAQELARFEKAKKTTELTDCFFFGDEFFFDLEDFLVLFDYDHQPKPEYVWACRPVSFVKIDLDNILERLCENADEDFDPSMLKGLDDLAKAIKNFEDANQDAVEWVPDFTTAILLNSEEEESE